MQVHRYSEEKNKCLDIIVFLIANVFNKRKRRRKQQKGIQPCSTFDLKTITKKKKERKETEMGNLVLGTR